MSNNVDFKKFLNVYEFTYKLPITGEEITFKPVTTGQLKKLLEYGDETSPVTVEKALDDLINDSVISEDFDVRELYLQDRFTLLVEIRKATKGPKYEFEYKCPSCDSQLYMVIDLNELPVIAPPEIDPHLDLTDEISVELDNIRRKDQIEASKLLKKNIGDLQFTAEMALLTYASGIKAINTPDGSVDNLSTTDKKFIIENVSLDAYEKIRDWYNKYDFGVDFKFRPNCHNCGFNDELNIPVNSFFL